MTTAIDLRAVPSGYGNIRLDVTFDDGSIGAFDIWGSTTNDHATASYLCSGSYGVAYHAGVNRGEFWYHWVTIDGGGSFFPAVGGVLSGADFIGIGDFGFINNTGSAVAIPITVNGDGIGIAIANGGGTGHGLTLTNNGSGGTGIGFLCNGHGSAALQAITHDGSGDCLDTTHSGSGAGFRVGHTGSGDGYLFVRSSGSGQYGYKATMSVGAFCFYASVSGSVGKYGPFTGAHDGLLKKQARIEPGDVVCDIRVHSRGGVSDTLTEIERSTRAGQKGVVGVYVGRRRIRFTQALLGEQGITRKVRQEFDLAVFNGLGQGQINACDESGPIEAGDLLVASSRPGKAMRQQDDIVRSNTVARARESAKGDAQIACIYLCG